MMQRVIVDTDPGIDDAAAIFLALASDAVTVEALTTTFGNAEVEQSTRNALTILEVAGRTDIPVHPGSTHPLVRDPTYAKMIHGDNGLGNVEFAPPRASPSATGAVEAIISHVMSAPGEITLVALGPLTNVALALSAEPRLASCLRRVILMGGAVLTWGNVSPAASANLFNDPEAARAVYRSGAPLVQVGLDVCRPTVITRSHLDRLRSAKSAPAEFLMRIMPFIQNAYRKAGIKAVEGGGVQFNDVPCMAYAIRPDLFGTRRLFVDIETQGALTAGATVADFDGRWGKAPNVDVCLEVNTLGVADLFADALTRWPA